MTCYMAQNLINFGALPCTGMASIDDFRTYTVSQAPGEYIDFNPQYFGCRWSGGGVLVAIFAVMLGAGNLARVFPPLIAIGRAKRAAVVLHKVIDRVPPIDVFDERGQTIETVNGALEVADVIFAYPTAVDHPILQGFTLSVESGSVCALVGASGSGKSTIIALVERFYDPMSGVVKLDGVDIKALNVRWLRRQLGLVSQEPVLFQGTVEANIRYGKEGASFEEVEEAARMANAHGFITADLGDGYETQVGQGGGKLSGGQKQRVAIARALIRKPAVLLLDEATSALDNESEKVVQAALDEIMAKQKRTTIVIAHRLSTIRGADKIAVVSKGRVVEQGKYDELVAIGDGGEFHMLAKRIDDMGATDMARMAEVRRRKEAIGVEVIATVEITVKPSSPKQRPTVGSDSDTPAQAAANSDEDAPPLEPRPFLRLMRMQGSNKALFAVGLGACLGTSGGPLVVFLFLTQIFVLLFSPDVDTMFSETSMYASFIFAIAGTVAVLSVVEYGAFGAAGANLTMRLRNSSMRSLLVQHIGFFDVEKNSSGALVAFLGHQITLVQALNGERLQLMVRTILMYVVALTFLFIWGSWQLFLVLIACVPIPVTLIVLSKKVSGDEKRRDKGQKSKEDDAEVSAGAIVGELVRSPRTVAAFSLEQHFYDRFDKEAQAVATIKRRQAILGSVLAGASFSIGFYLLAFVYYYGSWLISLDAIGFRAFFVTMTMIMVPTATGAGAFIHATDFKAAVSAAQQLFATIALRTRIDPLSDEGETVKSVNGALEVLDAHFAYPTAVDHPILQGFTLSVESGSVCALVGASGSGKSTIIALVERFYDPMSGVVKLDGVDIKALNVRWLRRQLGLVSQEPVLFQGTVEANIRYGKEGASFEEVEEAARMANAHGFITADLGDGYETQVGQGGGKLSGGQKQRVAIARALIRKPAVLLLDEATSALDNESEKVVQAALDEIMAKQKRTTIVIAHRLSTIRGADKIAVVSKGRVVEQGSHNELIELYDGHYFNLVEAQQR